MGETAGMHASASNRPRLLPRLGVCLTGTMVALILGGQAAPAEEPPEPPSPGDMMEVTS